MDRECCLSNTGQCEGGSHVTSDGITIWTACTEGIGICVTASCPPLSLRLSPSSRDRGQLFAVEPSSDKKLPITFTQPSWWPTKQ